MNVGGDKRAEIYTYEAEDQLYAMNWSVSDMKQQHTALGGMALRWRPQSVSSMPHAGPFGGSRNVGVRFGAGLSRRAADRPGAALVPPCMHGRVLSTALFSGHPYAPRLPMHCTAWPAPARAACARLPACNPRMHACTDACGPVARPGGMHACTRTLQQYMYVCT